jgi:putative inorganic carbon (HCO3(-)) transporter
MLFPSPERSLAMLVVPASWLLHWLMVSKQKTASRRQEVEGGSSILHASPSTLHILTPTPLNAALLLLALMVLVSEWATFDLAYSLPKISGMVLGFGIFFAVAREGELPRGRWLSLLAFLGVGLGITVLGVFGTRWATNKIALLAPILDRLPKLIAGLQGAESGFHPNEVAGALGWVLPMLMALSVALLFSPRRARPPKSGDTPSKNGGKSARRRSEGERKEGMATWERLSGWRLVLVTTLCLLATLFVGAVFVLTQSRGGYIGLALTLPLLILIALPRRWRWYSLIALVVLAILLGFLVSSHWEAIRIWVTGSDLAADPAYSLNTLEARLDFWSRAIYGIQDFPFTGMGMNVFRKVVPVLYPLFLVSLDKDIGHAHNEFLQAALDLGIPGLIAFLALYIVAFWMLADMWKATRQPQLNTDHWSLFTGHWPLVTRSLTLGLGGGLLAHMLYGLTDAVALGAKPGLLFWMLLGLIAGLHEQTRARESLAA